MQNCSEWSRSTLGGYVGACLCSARRAGTAGSVRTPSRSRAVPARQLPGTVPRAGYQVSGKKVAGPFPPRLRVGTNGRRFTPRAWHTRGAAGAVVSTIVEVTGYAVQLPVQADALRRVTPLAVASGAPRLARGLTVRYTVPERRM